MLINGEDFSILIPAEEPCDQNSRAWWVGWVPDTRPLTVPQHHLVEEEVVPWLPSVSEALC